MVEKYELAENDVKRYKAEAKQDQIKIDNLRLELQQMMKQRDEVMEENTNLQSDNKNLAGHSNHSQKLKYFSRLRDDYNKILNEKKEIEK